MTPKGARPISLFIPGLEGGGAQRVFANLANEFVDIVENPVHLVTIRKGGMFVDDVRPEVTIVNLGTGRVSRSIPALVRYLRSHRPVGFMSTMNYCNVAAIFAWRLAGRPCRLVVREANVVRKKRGLMHYMMRLTYPMADCVVALSPELRANLLQSDIYVADKTVVIGNPIALQSVNFDVNSLGFLPRPIPRFICAVGSLTTQKGFDVLIEAFSGLSDRDLHLIILGEGPLRERLEEQIRRLGLIGRVHMPGFIKSPASVVKQAEVFVLSSRWEGFPNVLLEALSTGVPVVATDCPGAPRSMLEGGRHGNLVLPGSPTSLCEGLESALKSPAGTAESRRARASEFEATKIAKKYLDIAFSDQVALR